MKINLLSDTVTRPTQAMLDAMIHAEVGDDVFGEDPSVNKLERKIAELFGKEAAVFCPSGTMTNQIAIKVHTNPLDELICEYNSHVYQYETGGYSFNSGVAINLIHADQGKLTAEQISAAVKPLFDWLPKSKLVVIENTSNKAGGSYYKLDEIKPIFDYCRNTGLKIHLDGARIFNALVETGESPQDHGNLFDSISVCLSKGLGAPVGSVLLGDSEFISEARRFRKVMGGGMRQAGYLAAAGIYALDHHIDRLKIDNDNAKIIGEVLESLPYIDDVRPVESNILIFELKEGLTPEDFLHYLLQNEIKATSLGPQIIRFVTHLDFTPPMMKKLIEVLEGYPG